MRPAASLAHSPEVAAAFEGLEVEELQYCSEVEDPAGPSSSGSGSSSGTISQVWVPLRLVRQPEAPSQQQRRRQRLPVAVLLHATGVDMGSLVTQQAAFARRGYLAATIDCRSVAAVGAEGWLWPSAGWCCLCWLHLISLMPAADARAEMTCRCVCSCCCRYHGARSMAGVGAWEGYQQALVRWAAGPLSDASARARGAVGCMVLPGCSRALLCPCTHFTFLPSMPTHTSPHTFALPVRYLCRAWRGSGERPFLLDNIWDIQRLLDYLQHRCTGCAGVLASPACLRLLCCSWLVAHHCPVRSL